MFNPSNPNVPPSGPRMMRPIMKRSEYTPVPSQDTVSCGSQYLTEPLRSTQTMVGVNRRIAFNLNNIYWERLMTTYCALSPYVYIVNINTIMARTRNCINAVEATIRNCPWHLEVNKNAVLLHDIEPRWHEVEGDSAILLTPNNYNYHKIYDDTDLNFSAVHREAQKYNEFTWQQQSWDTFWMQILLQHVVSYFKHSWSELTLHQRHSLAVLVERYKKSFSVFDQLTWIGYDCFIRADSKDLNNVNRTIHRMTGAPSNITVADLAVDFALNFSYTENVIDACDKHFEQCPRQRMPYTKMFSQN